MNNIDTVVNWWLNYKKLTSKELKLINEVRKEKPTGNYSENAYKLLENKLMSNLLCSNIDSDHYHITLSDTATSLIDQLFSKEVDDDTLVISTLVEHPSVQANLDKCKHVIRLNYYDHISKLDLSPIYQELSKVKKVFTYIIGTQISTGEITPQEYFIKLKTYLQERGYPTVMVIDDVHGMYIYPRDYSLFDYIIGTAHALIRPYDMGILISKKGDIGIKDNTWLEDYLTKLDILLSVKDKLDLFPLIMKEYFSRYPKFHTFYNTVHNIYAVKTPIKIFTQSMWDELDKYEIRLELGDKSSGGIIRFRSQQFITFPDFLIPGLVLLDEILSTIGECDE